ncbi:hypothetical protein [Laspinema olomoucense]|uniref:hypothetical protein n=1 Tax=Laspinema olomoucense TaxID=3231600 RepID=UPI0021BB757E|nr:hypothetical protein [Laspinema sp. D3a]MCT7990475.1 hypothetical protein [Laspinema sp. D3a]
MFIAKDEIRDRLLGWNSGAEDSGPKPLNLEELLTRIKAGLYPIHPHDPDILEFKTPLFKRKTLN